MVEGVRINRDAARVSIVSKSDRDSETHGELAFPLRPCSQVSDYENLDLRNVLYEGALGRSGVPKIRSTTAGVFLKPRNTFEGYQLSGNKKYRVSLELNSVEFPTDVNCTNLTPHITGNLAIDDLTEEFPHITTFFEGYIVNYEAFGFCSSSWDPADCLKDYKTQDSIDLEHWVRIPFFVKCYPIVTGGKTLPPIQGLSLPMPALMRENVLDVIYSTDTRDEIWNERYIFMKWKEKTLSPDLEVHEIDGTSYEGFYYIAHDQLTGQTIGFYYHPTSSWFQELYLEPCFLKKPYSSSSFSVT